MGQILAFVLISTETGRERKVLEDLGKIEDVMEAYVVYGLYDIIAVIDGENHEVARKTVFSKIRHLDGVRSTLTMIVASS